MPQPILVIVDVQERLFSAMPPDRRDDFLRNLTILGAAARRLHVPVLLTEQYPKGLGHTVPEVKAVVEGVEPIEKMAFSCCGVPRFVEHLRAHEADAVVLAGLEAHVCVLLTALDLLGRGFHVSLVADAVCSRKPSNLQIGLEQARQAGAILTSTETVVFQLLGRADHEAFRELSKLLR